MTSEKKSLVMSQQTKLIVRLVPPDGGWGWMVIIGTALSNVSIYH